MKPISKKSAKIELEAKVRDVHAFCDKNDLNCIIFIEGVPDDDKVSVMEEAAQAGGDMSCMAAMFNCSKKFKFSAYNQMSRDPMIQLMGLLFKNETVDASSATDPSDDVRAAMRGMFSKEDN